MNKIKTILLAASVAFGLGVAHALAAPLAIVAFGDSLTAGYGVAPGEAFPEQLQAALQARGHDVSVTNAGVSGDTSADGLARLEWSVPAEADIVIVELGANDALRGLDPAGTRSNIDAIVAKLTERGQAVLLAGMMAPRNLGHSYVEQFDAIYPDVASEHGVTLYPFFLEGVATDSRLNQADGLHPTGEGVRRIVAGILPQVEELIAARRARD
jgi:acyl-CoA thioesterase-1